MAHFEKLGESVVSFFFVTLVPLNLRPQTLRDERHGPSRSAMRRAEPSRKNNLLQFPAEEDKRTTECPLRFAARSGSEGF